MEIKNFEYNPILKEMLINYCYRIYQEDAIIDDEHLLMEYNLLLDDNKLNLLFEEEYLCNWLNDDGDR